MGTAQNPGGPGVGKNAGVGLGTDLTGSPVSTDSLITGEPTASTPGIPVDPSTGGPQFFPDSGSLTPFGSDFESLFGPRNRSDFGSLFASRGRNRNPGQNGAKGGGTGGVF